MKTQTNPSAGSGPDGEHPADALLRDVREISAQVGKLRKSLRGESLTELLAEWLSAQYARAIQRVVADAAGGELPLELLRKLNADVAVLRKGDQRARQLELMRERNEIERMKTREGREKEFVAWRKERRHEEKPPLTPEERERKMREIFGLRDGYQIPRERPDWKEAAERRRRQMNGGQETGEGEAGEETQSV